MQGEEVAKVDDFKYLGSTVQSNGECGREVKKRVQAGWNGWRRMSGVICDRRVPARVKGKVRVQGGSETSNVVRVGDGGTDEKAGGGDGGGRVEDVTIFIRSDKNGINQEWVHQRDSTGGTVWRENTRGEPEVVSTCTAERWWVYWEKDAEDGVARKEEMGKAIKEVDGSMWWKRTWLRLKWRRRIQNIRATGDGKSAVATSDGKKPKEEKEARDYPIPLVHQWSAIGSARLWCRPFCGWLLSENLTWNRYIAKTCNKATRTVIFRRRNLRVRNVQANNLTCKGLVRPIWPTDTWVLLLSVHGSAWCHASVNA